MFEDAVLFFMKKLKASPDSMESYIANSKSDTMELFSAIIEMMQARRDVKHVQSSDLRRLKTTRTVNSSSKAHTDPKELRKSVCSVTKACVT